MPFEDCPEWVKETTPEWVQPYLGKGGLPHASSIPGEPLVPECSGITLWQANHFVVYREGPEHVRLREYLYDGYSPLEVNYTRGTLPTYEWLVERCTAGCETDTERALALLTEALPRPIAEDAATLRAAMARRTRELLADRLWVFGLLNYPLPEKAV